MSVFIIRKKIILFLLFSLLFVSIPSPTKADSLTIHKGTNVIGIPDLTQSAFANCDLLNYRSSTKLGCLYDDNGYFVYYNPQGNQAGDCSSNFYSASTMQQGLSYYLYANESCSITFTPPTIVQVTLYPGTNIISVPIETTLSDIASICGNANLIFTHYTSSSKQGCEYDDNGYFVYYDAGGTADGDCGSRFKSSSSLQPFVGYYLYFNGKNGDGQTQCSFKYENGSIIQPPIPSSPVIDSDIRVQGTNIVDKYGNEVVIKGICVGHNDMFRKRGSSNSADYYYEVYFDETSAIDMKEHGTTHIDLHATWQTRFMKSDGEINVEYFEDWFDYFVDYCEDNEIPYIINMMSLRHLNLEWGPYNMPRFIWLSAGYDDDWWNRSDAYEIQADIIYKFFTSDNMEPSRQKWFNAWKFIADRYGDNRYLIGFSLTNEPAHFTCARGYLDYDQCTELGEGYSKTIERCIDEIRSTGADQIIFVDQPYLKNFDQIQPVNRDNIVWEAHKYHSHWTPNISEWKKTIDQFVQKFVVEFGKPLYIGEYGIDPISFKEKMSTDKVKDSVSTQVNYMDSKPIAGRAFFSWGELDGRGWADWTDEWYNEEETNYILQTIFG